MEPVIPRDFVKLDSRRKEKGVFGYKLGQHLKKLRSAKGISQEKLSMDAGYYHTYVNKIENGKYSPSMHTVWRLVHALGMTLSEFFKDFFVILATIAAGLLQKT
jgi:transcriptional regulator with XRE-family HTH domain